MRKYIYSWNPHSNSAKDLAEHMGIKRIKHKNSRYKHGKDNKIINWGSSSFPPNVDGNGPNIINNVDSVRVAANKLKTFKCLKEAGVKIPIFTTDIDESVRMSLDGATVIVRHVLNGNSGDGIDVIEPGMEMPEAPLYTKYLKKIDEWRIHIVGDKAICSQRKARKKEVPDDQVNWKIRNLAGGFIFAKNEGVEAPEEVVVESKKAIKALGLDFGAVDVVFNRNGAHVLEVNTAPGLEGTTIEAWADELRNFF